MHWCPVLCALFNVHPFIDLETPVQPAAVSEVTLFEWSHVGNDVEPQTAMVPPVGGERLTQNLKRAPRLTLGCDEFTTDRTRAKESPRYPDLEPRDLPVHDIDAGTPRCLPDDKWNGRGHQATTIGATSTRRGAQIADSGAPEMPPPAQSIIGCAAVMRRRPEVYE
jgi:hypothetical protein